VRVKEYLSQKNIKYTEYNVSRDTDKAREMIKKSGQMGVPVIMIDEQVVVGFNHQLIDKLLASGPAAETGTRN
jgi:glutaredoxin 3